MSGIAAKPGKLPAPPQGVRITAVRHPSDHQAPIAPKGNRPKVLRSVLLVAVVLGAAASGVFASSVLLPDDKAAEGQRTYVRDVTAAVSGLTIVFEQADESVKAFQNGWLAPEGAASQFGLLHEQVRHIKTDVSKTEPPEDMVVFHRQLGRSVTLTQQAMDAMQEGFASGDATYFTLAGEKLTEARVVLDKAYQEL